MMALPNEMDLWLAVRMVGKTGSGTQTPSMMVLQCSWGAYLACQMVDQRLTDSQMVVAWDSTTGWVPLMDIGKERKIRRVEPNGALTGMTMC